MPCRAWRRWPATRPCCWPRRRLPKMFPMMMTAAGTLLPARALILGVGVAGLQAIATARRHGRRGRSVRRAARRQGPGAEPGREVPRFAARDRRCARRRRLCQGLRRIVLSSAARVADWRRSRAGRGDHHGRGAGTQSADPDHDRNGRGDAAWLGDRRSGGRARRQLRADATRARPSCITA